MNNKLSKKALSRLWARLFFHLSLIGKNHNQRRVIKRHALKNNVDFILESGMRDSMRDGVDKAFWFISGYEGGTNDALRYASKGVDNEQTKTGSNDEAIRYLADTIRDCFGGQTSGEKESGFEKEKRPFTSNDMDGHGQQSEGLHVHSTQQRETVDSSDKGRLNPFVVGNDGGNDGGKSSERDAKKSTAQTHQPELVGSGIPVVSVLAGPFTDLGWRVEIQNQKGHLYWLHRRTLPDGKRISRWRGRCDQTFSDTERMNQYKRNSRRAKRKRNGK